LPREVRFIMGQMAQRVDHSVGISTMASVAMEGIAAGELLPRRSGKDLLDRWRYSLKVVEGALIAEAESRAAGNAVAAVPPTSAQVREAAVQMHPAVYRSTAPEELDTHFQRQCSDEMQYIEEAANA